MPSISELERTKTELGLALQELDQLERLSIKVNTANNGSVASNAQAAKVSTVPPVTRMSEADRLKVESIKEANAALRLRNTELEKEVSRYREERRKVDTDLKQIQTRSDKLKEDIEKVGSEKALLTQIVKNTQGENEVLSKVMNKISNDYEELKKAFDSQKCPKDDKIMALRKTARALETENELLQEEKMKIIKNQDRIRTDMENMVKDRNTKMDSQSRELANVKLERDQLRGRLTHVEKDKDGLAAKVTTLEKDLQAAKAKAAKKNKK